jgi:hypothetical protein
MAHQLIEERAQFFFFEKEAESAHFTGSMSSDVPINFLSVLLKEKKETVSPGPYRQIRRPYAKL